MSIKPEKNNNEKYNVQKICDSKIYTNKLSNDHLPNFYFLVFWEGYLEEENTLELALAIQHLWKLIITFHKDHPEKPTAISPLINSALLMVKPTIKPKVKTLNHQKHGWFAKATDTNKCLKKSRAFNFYFIFGPVLIKSKIIHEV